MIKCPFCQATQVTNTLFCNECGTHLLQEDAHGTDQLSTDELKWVGEDKPKVSPSKKSDPALIRLKIRGSGREVEATLANTIHLGRIDPANDVFPEVDLSIDGGLKQGISRRHARIFKKEGMVKVEDVGSINGAFINGRRLAPYLPEVLHHKDLLQLGKLLIQIELLESTEHVDVLAKSGPTNKA